MQIKTKAKRAGRDYMMAFCSLAAAAVAMLIFTAALSLELLPALPDGSGTETSGAPGTQNTVRGDTQPPEILGARDMTVYIGEPVSYRKNIRVVDNVDSSEEINLKIDSSKVNLAEVGKYAVTYTATDRAGNSNSVTIFVTVIEPEIPLETLNAALDGIIKNIIRPGMSKEEKCRAVCAYVKGHIAYSGTSEKANGDWRSEAYRALFVSGSGDCYSYFAASKALLERLGIENLDIQRTPELVPETHYWSLVNIAEEGEEARWYHYDSTRITPEYDLGGCLMTERQIEAYNHVREYFYAYDKSAYPSACEKIITPTPGLEPYYD
ncbi:MAG: DUF5011 domain-containing protein [Clostridiales bacterium]|nr:DUF5011 domain-containing protein [Clostridiales bacterium]